MERLKSRTGSQATGCLLQKSRAFRWYITPRYALYNLKTESAAMCTSTDLYPYCIMLPKGMAGCDIPSAAGLPPLAVISTLKFGM